MKMKAIVYVVVSGCTSVGVPQVIKREFWVNITKYLLVLKPPPL